MGIDILISFLTSYISGSLPTLNKIFSKDQGKNLRERINKCYKNALKLWIADNNIRERIAKKNFSSISQLQELCKSPEWKKDSFQLNNLANLWVEELCKDETCIHYIHEQKLKSVGEKIDKLTDFLMKQEYNKTLCIRRGLTKHKAVEGYIRRYCTSEEFENKYIYYILNQDESERHILSDYVTGLEGVDTNKFILYSGAQTGKTTELKQLCWELQNSGLYMPVSFEVRLNTNLKRGDLPSFQYIDNKEIVVIIDALDEVNGSKYDNLIEEIGGYAYEHPEMKIVLSCRNNYRKENRLNMFKNLFLEELSFDDVQKYTYNVLGKDSRRLFAYVEENLLTDFIKNPFSLNILINVYKKGIDNMPKTKADLYKLFIEDSYKKEKKEKNVHLAFKHNFEDSVSLLERIALVLSLMNEQSLSEDELKQCLYNKQTYVDECKRYGLIRCEGDRYSFENNAFREWLVANYLSHEGIKKAKLLAVNRRGNIKPEWYNIIMLWLSMYGKDRKNEINEIFDWLKNSCFELIIYLDKDMLDENTRNYVFEEILLHYKHLGIRMSNITTQDYKNLLLFGQSEKTLRFIINELKNAKLGTAYFVDLMCLCYFMKWELLNMKNKTLTNDLFNVLELKTKETLEKGPICDMSFIYFENDFFKKDYYFERIFNIVKYSNNCQVIESTISFIDAANKVDEHIDYILDKEKYVYNKEFDGITCTVSRSIIYNSLSKLKSLYAVKKLLCSQICIPNVLDYKSQDEYLYMMENLLMIASDFIRHGEKYLIDEIYRCYYVIYKEYEYDFDSNDLLQKLLKSFRSYYKKTDLVESGKTYFYKQLQLSFLEKINEENIHKTFSLAALWITEEDVKNDFNNFSVDNKNDLIKAGWYEEIPYHKVAEYATDLYNSKFKRFIAYSEIINIKQKSFNDFTNYETFKNIVLKMISELDNRISMKEMKEKFDSGYNPYAYYFLQLHVDKDNKYNKENVITNINNQSFYEAFLMKEVSDLIDNTFYNQILTDEVKKQCFKYAQVYVMNYCKHTYPVYYLEIALRFMLNGYFEIPKSCLTNLLDYADVSISGKHGETGFNTKYNVFDYICERLDADVLAEKVIKKLDEYVRKKNFNLSYIFSKYIIENYITEGYDSALEFALTNLQMSSNILWLLIKNQLKIEEIKASVGSFNIPKRITCYYILAGNKFENLWVKEQLESEYKTYDNCNYRYRATKLLLNLGSVDALDYLYSNINMIDFEDDLYFNYDNPNSISLLCFFIKYNIENYKEQKPLMLDSLISSLEKIAMNNNDSLIKVEYSLKELIKEGEKYKFLNRCIISFDKKFDNNHFGINSINDALNLVDTEA